MEISEEAALVREYDRLRSELRACTDDIDSLLKSPTFSALLQERGPVEAAGAAGAAGAADGVRAEQERIGWELARIRREMRRVDQALARVRGTAATAEPGGVRRTVDA